jgi:hypothetical protein
MRAMISPLLFCDLRNHQTNAANPFRFRGPRAAPLKMPSCKAIRNAPQDQKVPYGSHKECKIWIVVRAVQVVVDVSRF